MDQRLCRGARTKRQKRAAVIDLCATTKAARQVAEELGVSRHTLYKWKDQRLGRKAPTSTTHHSNPPQPASREYLKREFERLRKDLQRLQLEHDLLQETNKLLKKNCASTCGFWQAGRRHGSLMPCDKFIPYRDSCPARACPHLLFLSPLPASAWRQIHGAAPRLDALGGHRIGRCAGPP